MICTRLRDIIILFVALSVTGILMCEGVFVSKMFCVCHVVSSVFMKILQSSLLAKVLQSSFYTLFNLLEYYYGLIGFWLAPAQFSLKYFVWIYSWLLQLVYYKMFRICTMCLNYFNIVARTYIDWKDWLKTYIISWLGNTM